MCNSRMNNKGSATIFMIILLIPLVIFVCMIIRYAQLAATKGMAADAVGLATNAIYASYNKPMRDAYGICCYTKTAEEMTEMANYHMNNSLDINASGTMVVSCDDQSLSDNDIFSQQVVAYMKNWNKVAHRIEPYQLLWLQQNRERSIEISQKFHQDYERAINSSYSGGTGNAEDGEISLEDAKQLRKDVVKLVNVDNLCLDFGGANNEDKPNYSSSTSLIDSTTPIIDWEKDTTVNVNTGIQILSNAQYYLEPLDAAFYSKLNKDVNYNVALYAVNNFSAFNYYGPTALTGNNYLTGDVVSISGWAETEFLLNGLDSDQNNADTVKRMVYDIIFMEYVTKMYDVCMSDPNIQKYAEVLSEGNPDMVELIKDELLIGVCGQLAYETYLNTYNFGTNDDVSIDNYAQYLELFLLLEANRDFDGLVDRMQYLITENMHNPVSSEEAHEFSFDSAYLMPVVDSYYVTVTPSFGGSVSFEGR